MHLIGGLSRFIVQDFLVFSLLDALGRGQDHSLEGIKRDAMDISLHHVDPG
jgi:hypothetical protein